MRRSLPFMLMAMVSLGLLGWPGTASAGLDSGITWLGHASFRLERRIARQPKVVYIDPWQIAGEPQDADVILITHPHFDHLSLPDIRKLVKGTTVIVGPPDCLTELTGDLRPVKPGDHLELDGIAVDAVPAYNTNTPHHPKANQWVGYVVQLGKVRIYHAGDTDVIPEMHTIRADVALVPVSGTYVMNADQAYMAVSFMDPKLVIPMHYGSIVGSVADAERLKERCGTIPVKIYPRPSARS